MRITVDSDRCVGHGLCEATSPEVFEVNDDGYVDIDGAAADTADESVLREAAANCPSAALTLEP
ncbi:ferredoxin [Streptomyces sp. SID6673]|nr:ferredoxin [Streptomyces sp. SID11726]NEB26758.1 ferredoxin [Streptomyces sp. SID6673]